MVTLAGTAPATAKGNDGKFDRHLRERLAKTSDADPTPESVILTVRPGARRGLVQRLRAMGATVNEDFTIIDASSAKLPARVLRQLADDKDVLAISTDAELKADGVTSPVSGAPANSPYSLRSTLGLEAATSGTATFQQGANGYTGTVDGGVNGSSTKTNYATATSIKVEMNRGLLLRFDNLFGSGVNQIPTGATITSASLQVTLVPDGSAKGPAGLHRMLVTWNDTATWNSMTTSGAGIQRDNVEASAVADASITSTNTTGTRTFSGSNVTATVQAWASGQPNYGWVLWHPDDDGWTVRTAQDGTRANRPLLTVTYQVPRNTTALTGSGVTVAVIDSGLLQDGGGTARIKTTRDFTGGANNPSATTAADAYGHGMHVAGLIGDDQAENKGAAPGVSYVSLRVLNNQGIGATSNVIKALQWAVANRSTYGIDVINLSLGHPIYEPAATDPLVQAVEAAARAGIAVVVSAGNIGTNPFTGEIGYGGITSPGNAPSAITVGAARTFDTTTRTDDTVAEYSSRGPSWYDAYAKPDIIAPGHRLLGPAVNTQTLYSLFPSLRGPTVNGRASLVLSGTSMATAVVSGTVALMIEGARAQFGVEPTPNALKAMLQHTAFPMSDAGGHAYDVLTQGAGGLNAIGAVTLAQALDPRVAAGQS
ncbi:MAG: S8 family serine peptidase, partial [Vicinamibacterales bacterium]